MGLLDFLNPQGMSQWGGFTHPQQDDASISQLMRPGMMWGGDRMGMPPQAPQQPPPEMLPQQGPMEMSAQSRPPQQPPAAPSMWSPNHPLTANLPIHSLMGFGMGMLSGTDRASGWGNALAGMAQGRAYDTQQRKEAMQRAALAGMYGGAPGAAGAAGGAAGGGAITSPTGIGGGRYGALAAAFPDKAAAAAFERLKPQNLSPGNSVWVDRGDGVPVQVAAAPHKPERVTTQGPGGETYEHYSQPPSGQMSGTVPVAPQGGGGMPSSIGPGAIEGLTGTQKQYTEMATEHVKGAASGHKMLGSLKILDSQMADPNFYSGIGSGLNKTARQALVAIGFDPQLAASAEAFNAQTKRLIMDGLNGSLGNGVSNADTNIIKEQVPSIDATPEGNKRLIAIARSLAERQIETAKFVAQYQSKHGRFDANGQLALEQWKAENPLVIPEGAQPKQQAAPDPKAGIKEPYDYKGNKWRRIGNDPSKPSSWRRVE